MYMAQLDKYIKANSIHKTKNVVPLLTVIGWPPWKLLEIRLATAMPTMKGYVDLCNVLSGHLALKLLVIAEQQRFH